MRGSCNGLILFTDGEIYQHQKDMLLLNPTTREIVSLPRFSNPQPIQPDSVSKRSIWFGYDSVTKDYKVVKLHHFNPGDNLEERYVQVYSIKRGGAVRRVDNSGFGDLFQSFNIQDNGAFANGSLHWLVGDSNTGFTSSIGAFDLNEERFCLIGLPTEFNNPSIGSPGINVHGGCLCVVKNLGEDGIYMWVMKEYKAAESWVKFHIHLPNGIQIDEFFTICLVGDHKLLSFTMSWDWFVSSLKEGTSETVTFGELPVMEEGHHYIDTLVSPKNHMSAKHYKVTKGIIIDDLLSTM